MYQSTIIIIFYLLWNNFCFFTGSENTGMLLLAKHAQNQFEICGAYSDVNNYLMTFMYM